MNRQEQKSASTSIIHYLIPASVLAAVTAIVYYPSLNYAFQFDDISNISLHYSIRHYTFGQLFFSGTRWISYWLNTLHYQIGRFDPWAYRAFNVCLHTANGILVFFILLRALSGLKRSSFFKDNAFLLAFVTSLLFLLHPVQTQTVSYVIQGQLEGLAAFFILSMTWCLLAIKQASRPATRYSLTLSLFSLALLSCGSKEITIIAPALLVLFDWFFIAQGCWQSLKTRALLHSLLMTVVVSCYLWMLKPEFFTSILGFSRVAYNNIGNVITANPADIITPWAFFISQFKVVVHYLWIFIWPFSISVEYDWALSPSFFSADCLAPLALLGALCIYIGQLLKKNPAHCGAFGALWFAVCMAPRSSIIPSPELLVDYKTYTASVGWLFILAMAIVYIIKKIVDRLPVSTSLRAAQPFVPVALSILLAIPLGHITMQRNTVWRSGLEFWGNILQNAPGKARAYNNYGVQLSQNPLQFEHAIPYFKKAIEMDPNYPDPCNNIAIAYSNTNQLDLAIQALLQAIAINPNYPETYNNLASFYLRKNDLEKAQNCLDVALAMRPHYGKAHFNCGRLHIERGNKEKAWECFKDACTIADLDDELGFCAYGQMSLTLKKFDDAITAYTKALECNRNNTEALFNLANSYFFTAQYDSAEIFYKRMLALDAQNVNALYNLGETYFVTNKILDALECFTKISSHKKQLPQISLRLAGCHEKMGNPHLSQEIIYDLLSEPLTAPVKTAAQDMLAQLESSYYLPRPAPC